MDIEPGPSLVMIPKEPEGIVSPTLMVAIVFANPEKIMWQFEKREAIRSFEEGAEGRLRFCRQVGILKNVTLSRHAPKVGKID